MAVKKMVNGVNVEALFKTIDVINSPVFNTITKSAPVTVGLER